MIVSRAEFPNLDRLIVLYSPQINRISEDFLYLSLQSDVLIYKLEMTRSDLKVCNDSVVVRVSPII